MKSARSNPKIKRQRQVIFGGALLLISLLLFISFVSYLINWEEDYSSLGSFFDRSVDVQNILSKTGLFVSHLLIYRGVGLASFILTYLLSFTGFILFFDKKNNALIVKWSWGILHTIWLTIAIGYFIPLKPLYSGIIGYEINKFLIDYIGRIGIFSGLIFFFLCFIVFQLEWTPEKMKNWINNLFKKSQLSQNFDPSDSSVSFDIKNNQTEKNGDVDLKNHQEKQNKFVENPNAEKDEIEIQI